LRLNDSCYNLQQARADIKNIEIVVSRNEQDKIAVEKCILIAHINHNAPTKGTRTCLSQRISI